MLEVDNIKIKDSERTKGEFADRKYFTEEKACPCSRN